MSRRSHYPAYRLHKQSGQAVVTLTDPSGRRHDVLLGKYETTQSHAEYDRVIAEWVAVGRRLLEASSNSQNSALTVNELVLAFWQHAERHYRHADGSPTRELADFKLSLRPLKHLYGETPASAFGPLALKAVRQLMIEGYEHKQYSAQAPLARGVVNQRVGRVRRVFRWGVEQEMIPASAYQGLIAVRGLARGRSGARETKPVTAIAEEVVHETLSFLNRHAKGIVEMQLLTGMRPGEACVMRACDIEITGKVWLYRPQQHKTAHHGYQRVIAIGPKAQEIIREFLTLDTQAFLFSPRRSLEEIRERMRQNRKTRVQPSQSKRRKRNPRRAPGDVYTTCSYGHAIRKAIHAANKAKACEQCKRLKPEQRCETCKANALPHWHPHQLRHTAATKIRKEYGLDVARVVLGHRSPQITELYAELDTSRASAVMEALG